MLNQIMCLYNCILTQILIHVLMRSISRWEEILHHAFIEKVMLELVEDVLLVKNEISYCQHFTCLLFKQMTLRRVRN